MRIEGIGVINKNKALSILTKEGREAVKAGEITIEELGEMYKLQLVQKNSKIGNMGDTFRESFKDTRRSKKAADTGTVGKSCR